MTRRASAVTICYLKALGGINLIPNIDKFRRVQHNMLTGGGAWVKMTMACRSRKVSTERDASRNWSAGHHDNRIQRRENKEPSRGPSSFSLKLVSTVRRCYQHQRIVQGGTSTGNKRNRLPKPYLRRYYTANMAKCQYATSNDTRRRRARSQARRKVAECDRVRRIERETPARRC